MFVLIPLFLTLLFIAYVFYSVLTLSQLNEYILFVSQVTNATFSFRLLFQFLASASLYFIATYWLLRFTNIAFSNATIKKSGAPRLGFVLRLLVVLSPTILLAYALARDGDPSKLVSSALVVLVLLLIFEVLVEASRFFKIPWLTEFVPSSSLIFWLDASTLVALAGVYVFFAYDIVTASNFLGLFSAVFVFLAIVFAALCGILTARRAGHPIISILAVSVVGLYLISDLIPSQRELRSSSVLAAQQGAKVSKTSAPTSTEVLRNRALPDLAAFTDWLQGRPHIRETVAAGKKYPVFVVAAQGGGYYAAYHAALTLAAIQDSCPEFADHVFAVIGVSGGGVGATVFTELLRAGVPKQTPEPEKAARAACSQTISRGPMANATQRFFKSDFLTPVIASGLLFDSVRLLAPQWPIGPDRARALEYGFEGGWRDAMPDADAKIGMSGDFYGHWDARASVPALFLATTGVNTGTPVLASQINWSEVPDETVAHLAATSLGGGPAQIGLMTSNSVSEILARRSYVNRTFANLLDYRPDLQIPTSAAAALTARFPYVTPPGTVSENKAIAQRKRVFQDLKRIDLVDGGFWDNSGMAAAGSLINKLSDNLTAADRLVEAIRTNEAVPVGPQPPPKSATLQLKRSDVEFHLISLTHADVYLNHPGSPSSTSEVFLPLTVFDRVRVSRRGLAGQLTNPNLKAVHPIGLFDQNFEAPLTWVLAGKTKHAIEVRSGLTKSANDNDWMCCIVRSEFPTQNGVEFTETVAAVPKGEEDTFRDEIGKPVSVNQDGWIYSVSSKARITTSTYLPNAKVFEAILAVVRDVKAGPTTSSTGK